MKNILLALLFLFPSFSFADEISNILELKTQSIGQSTHDWKTVLIEDSLYNSQKKVVFATSLAEDGLIYMICRNGNIDLSVIVEAKKIGTIIEDRFIYSIDQKDGLGNLSSWKNFIHGNEYTQMFLKDIDSLDAAGILKKMHGKDEFQFLPRTTVDQMSILSFELNGFDKALEQLNEVCAL